MRAPAMGHQKEGGYENGYAVYPGNPRVSRGLRDSLGDRLVPRRYGLQPEAEAHVDRIRPQKQRRGRTQKGCLARRLGGISNALFVGIN